MIDIVAVGEIVIDFSPLANASNGNPRYEAQPGGAASNMLAEASQLGASVQLLGAVGRDPLGDFLCKVAERYRFAGDGLVRMEDLPTPLTLVSFDKSGDRSFYFVQTKTVLQAFQPDMLNIEIFQQARMIYLAGCLLGMENGRRVFTRAKELAIEQGKTICCDINWRPGSYPKSEARQLVLPYLQGIDVLKVSLEEMEMLTNESGIEKGSEMLMNEGIRLTCVTLGDKGCYFRYRGGTGYVPAYHPVVIDTNAAGDVFTAAVLVSLLKRNRAIDSVELEDMREIMKYANAASAVCVSRKGAIYAVPSAGAVRAFQSSTEENYT